jgi:sulfite exporter TauE/SafE/copper chaperone CopZ
MENQSKRYIFHVTGMHCRSCELLIEDELKNLSNISMADANLGRKIVTVDGNFGDRDRENIASELTGLISKHGYYLSVEKISGKRNWLDFKFALPIALAFIVAFILLQKAGLVNLIGTGKVSLGTAFVVGVIASLSTCMAVVGGLVLSMSATFSKEGDKIRPQILFHVGRIVSFIVFGGIIGAIGSAFTLDASANFVISLLIGLIMLILGINLLDVFHWSKRLQPTMPRFLSSHAFNITKINHTLTPFLIGVSTFFLPCGFTQAMQIFTLSTGSFVSGAMTMLVFALGTFPILALVSFSSFSVNTSSKAGVFFKTAGLIVIMFAIFNIINSLAAIGLISPVFNF